MTTATIKWNQGWQKVFLGRPNQKRWLPPKFSVQLSHKLNFCSSSIVIIIIHRPHRWCYPKKRNILSQRTVLRTLWNLDQPSLHFPKMQLLCFIIGINFKICAHTERERCLLGNSTHTSWPQLGAQVLDWLSLEEQALLVFVFLGCGFAASGFSTPSIHHAIRFVHHAQNCGLKFQEKQGGVYTMWLYYLFKLNSVVIFGLKHCVIYLGSFLARFL